MDLTKSKNANKMKSIQEKSNEQGNGAVTINIALDQIDENPDNEKTFNMEKVDSISKSIEQVGFFGAINVFKKPDGRYEISSGHTRYRAMKKLGRNAIPCIVSAYPDEFKRGLMLLSSNVNNRVMKPMDWAKSIDYYYELMKNAKKEYGKGEQSYTGRLRDQAADFFDMSPANIQKYYSLLKLIPELQELANDPEFSYSAFCSAATLSKEEQKDLSDRINEELESNAKKAESGEGIAGVSRTRIEQMINNLKNKPDNTAQQNKSKGNFVTAAFQPVPQQEEEYREVTSEVDVPAEFGEDAYEEEYEVQENAAQDNEETSFDAMTERDRRGEEDISYNAGEYDTGAATVKNTSSSADVLLTSFAPEIEKIVSGVYEIYNSDMAKRYLKRIKTAIEKIEEML